MLMEKKRTKKIGLGNAIFKMEDIKPCLNDEEHFKRVLTRESTPWVKYKFTQSFPAKSKQ